MVKWTTASYSFFCLKVNFLLVFPVHCNKGLSECCFSSLQLRFTIYHNNSWKCTSNRMERRQRYVTPSRAHSTRLSIIGKFMANSPR